MIVKTVALSDTGGHEPDLTSVDQERRNHLWNTSYLQRKKLGKKIRLLSQSVKSLNQDTGAATEMDQTRNIFKLVYPNFQTKTPDRFRESLTNHDKKATHVTRDRRGCLS